MTPGKCYPRAPVSWGELIDKLTILEIKAERLRAPGAKERASAELALLLDVLSSLQAPPVELAALKSALGEANRRLWTRNSSSLPARSTGPTTSAAASSA